MNVEIWIDLVCPWCYLGKRRFERALEGFADSAALNVRWRSYQLDPAAPAHYEGTLEEWLTKRYGFGIEQARAGHARMSALGAAEGVVYDFEGARPGNTRDAHRLVQLARSANKATELVERLMRGYFEQRMPIADHAALTAAATEVGLDVERVGSVLSGDEFDREVKADQVAARERGFNGVPAFVLAGQVAVSGAQSADVFRAALERAAALPH